MTVADDLATLRGWASNDQEFHDALDRVEDEITQLEERANFADAYKYRQQAEAAEAEVARLKGKAESHGAAGWARAMARHAELERRAEAAEVREARLRDGLRAIADRVYPAIYIGEAKDGTKMYGGSDDASRFARSLLDESDAP